MRDPLFRRSVAFVCQHSEEGAMGLLINRLSEYRLGDVLAQMNLQSEISKVSEAPVLIGGPVQPELGFVIHSAEYRRAGTMDVDGRIAMTASRQVLQDIGHKQGPEKSLFALGYAGWGPGQLEGELARHDWFSTPEQPNLVFDDDRDKLWEEAMARRTREL